MEATEDKVLDLLGNWAREQKLKYVDGVITKRKTPVDPAKIYPQFIARIMQELPSTVPPSPVDFLECLKYELDKPAEYRDTQFKIPTVESVADFIPMILEREGIFISALGDEVSDRYGRSISAPELENIFVCQGHLYNEESSQGGEQLRRTLSGAAVKDFIRKEVLDRASDHWIKTRKVLLHDPTKVNYTDTILAAIIKEFKFLGDPELNLAVLKQWIWQTKRFFMGEKVTDPLMLNLFAAKGGGGKTQIVKKLTQPLEEYTATSTLDAILDSREHGLFTDRYVVFFDEMSLGKIESGQVAPLLAALKKLVTEDKITQRNMRENSHSKKRRTFSPVATSNQPLAQVLPDDSGMRRFYEIEMMAEPNSERVGKLISIDATIIWQGIDEKLERGYIIEGTEIHKKLLHKQSQLKHRSILDDCLENMEDVAVLNTTPAAMELLKMEAENATPAAIETRAEELGLRIYSILEYRKLVKEWCEDNIDKQLTKWLPGHNKLPQDLVARDLTVFIKDKKKIKVLVKEADLGGGYV